MDRGRIRCAVYARVSTDKQGDSIENQVSQCREYISRLGDQYDTQRIAVYRDEAVSGYYTSVFDRAEMKRAIRDARDGKFRLLVFKEVSRVGRDKQENPAIIGMFEQYGVRVVAINDNYDSLNKDNITFDIISVLSEQESKKIAARVSSARKQKARRGQWGGEAPIGYQINKTTKKLEIDPRYSEVPPLIFDLYVNGGLGTFKVAEHLNLRGIQTRKGNRWSRESVNKLLRNPAYIGSVVYGARRNQLERKYDDSGKMTKKKVQIRLSPQEWQIVEEAHEALVDRETFDAAQRIMDKRGRLGASRRGHHPLTGLLICGRCGEGMVCQKRTYHGKTYRYYICKTYHKYGRAYCPQRNVNADELERTLLTIIRARLKELPDDLVEIRVDTEKNRRRLCEQLNKKRSLRDKCEKNQFDLLEQRELFGAGTFQRRMLELKRQIQHLDEEIRSGEAQMMSAMDQSQELSSSDLINQGIREFKQLELPSSSQIRVLMQALMKSIRLTGNQLDIVYRYKWTCNISR